MYFGTLSVFWNFDILPHAYFLRTMRVFYQKRVASGVLDSNADTCLKWFISFILDWNQSRFPHDNVGHKGICAHFLSFFVFHDFRPFFSPDTSKLFSISLDVGAEEAFSFKAVQGYTL